MSPSTNRRPRPHRTGSSPDHDRPDSSPSRPRTKRRKLQDSQDPVPLPADQVNIVIASLALPDPNVTVAIQHANDENFRQNTQGITAYAKIAGSTWTYYVKDLVIRIGRPPGDGRPGTAGSLTPPPQPRVEDVVHIDLGPSKLISRNHATISYDMNGQHNWQLHVHGRNGVKVDDEMLKKDGKTALRSGSILEIAGVQMMFVLPDTIPYVTNGVIRRLRANNPVVEELQHLHPVATNDPSNDDTATIPSSQNALQTSAQLYVQSSITAVSPPQPEPAVTKSKNQSVYQRGLVLESTEDVDYADDGMKEVKPPYSYAVMIAQAILSTKAEQLTLSSIYQYIMDKYAFYRHSNTGWQNSIRHNLSLNKAFRKIPRRSDEPGKGMKWELLPEHRDEYIAKIQKAPGPKTGPGRHGPLAPVSPASPKASKPAQTPVSKPLSRNTGSSASRLEDSPDLNPKQPAIKRSPRSMTPPPVIAYRVAPLEAYTPDRGSKVSAVRNEDSKMSETFKTRRTNTLFNPDIVLSSTAHMSSSIHGHPSSQILPTPLQTSPLASSTNKAATAVTPAPQRRHPVLAPPSTGQLPSSYLPTSSPAPFWKYVSFGSTPAKPGDYSPCGEAHGSSPPPVIPSAEGAERRCMRELVSPLKDRSGAMIPDIEEADEDGMGDLQNIDLAR
ncbi:transcription factor [Rhizina undulata]